MNALRLFALLCSLASPAALAAATTQTFGIHLYFDEKEYVDTLTLTSDDAGQFTGDMHVPNDFDGPLENLTVTQDRLAFDLLVPKNGSRPTDLVFHYEGRFFDASQSQLTGFVTIKDELPFVAAFVAFKR